jgi:tetratricopeptide (TPR) repeat protein
MKCLCLPDPVNRTPTAVDHIRLFRNDPRIRWRYRVHEQILPAIREAGGTVRWADVTIQHTGYQDLSLRSRKLERDMRLLYLENSDRPDDPFTLFNLGSVCLELGRVSEAIPLFQRSLERSHPSDSIVRKLYALIAQCHRQLGQPNESLASCRRGRSLYPDDVELLFQEALIYRENGNRAVAEACWLRLLEDREVEHFASLDLGLKGYKTRHNLAMLYQEQGRWAEAEAQWQAALHENPEFFPARIGLAELLLAQARWKEFENACDALVRDFAMPVETAVLRARAMLARSEFDGAHRLMTETIEAHPQTLWPRVILSHVLLQEGKDWTAAEEALRDVLRMEPNHPEARRNLDVLLRQRRSQQNLSIANAQ